MADSQALSPKTVGLARYAESDALDRASIGILAAFMVIATLPFARWSLHAQMWLPLAIHVLALGACAYVGWSVRVERSVRAWTPLALVPLLYVELRWIIAGVGRPHADALVAGWDLRLFGEAPSRTLALAWPSLALSEALHLCYLAYYAIVYVPPALLWWKARDREFAATVLAIVVMYVLCFIAFVIFPVDGPRFLAGPAAAPGGPIRSIVLQILAAGSSRGTAFPSAHVAASVVAGITALRFQRALGIAILMVTAGMMVGAVYGGYHYAVDVMAGLAMGLLASAVARATERFIVMRSTGRP
ncbi:MAG: phosphatase PAP2 family protein [bacterium]